jgi:hypothetical protein
MALGEQIIRVPSIPTIALNGIDRTADASGALTWTGCPAVSRWLSGSPHRARRVVAIAPRRLAPASYSF